MSNFGVVQSSAATTIGLQSPEMVLIQIQMLKNANEQREDTFAIGAEVTNDKNAATMEYGDRQAAETRINAESQISGGLASAIVMGGASVQSISLQSEVDTMNKQLQNVGTFKANLITGSPESIGFNVSTVSSPQDVLEFKNDFNGAKTLDEKAVLFNDKPKGYFEDAAKQFSGDTPESKAVRKQAIDKATELEQNLRSQVAEKSDKIKSKMQTGQSFGPALSGLVSGSFTMRAAETKVEQAQEQVLQNMADNSKSFVETMQSTMDQMVQMSLKGIEQLMQNLQSVVQASNARA